MLAAIPAFEKKLEMEFGVKSPVFKLIENNVAGVEQTHLLALSALSPKCETLPNPAHLWVCVQGGGGAEHRAPSACREIVEVWNCSNPKI